MFKPNYQNVVDCAYNREPKRVPLYEHNISANIMDKSRVGNSYIS